MVIFPSSSPLIVSVLLHPNDAFNISLLYFHYFLTTDRVSTGGESRRQDINTNLATARNRFVLEHNVFRMEIESKFNIVEIYLFAVKFCRLF